MILTETRGRVRIITLNRPEKRNALNGPLCAALLAGLREAEADPAIAAVVLAGAGRGFSAGADLGEREILGDDPKVRAERAQLSLDMLAAPGLMGKPVVAALHGPVIGAGATIALCCDLAVAADDTRIAYPEAKHGIFPSLVAPALLRHLGPKLSFELLATGRDVLAEEALRLQMVNKVVPRAELLDAACALAEAAALYPAEPLLRIKAMIGAGGTGTEPSAK